MNFNKHSEIEGQHAFLSASKHYWIGYDTEKVSQAYLNFLATQRGTELHEFACRCIQLGQTLPKARKTLNMYVNDSIGFKMTPEQPLYYSENCFGTADAIAYRRNALRIHDLKTGKNLASMDQLMIYAALFCLEYDKQPNKMDIELRIYQNNDVLIHEPPADDIFYIMDKIILFDKEIEKIKAGE